MPLPVLIQAAWKGSSGLAEDQYVNTFHIGKNVGEISNAEAEDAIEAIHDAYLDIASSTNMFSWFSEDVNSQVVYKAYRLSDPEPRAPIVVDTRSVAGGNTGNGRLPGEVAICLSYQGDAISGSPQARRRGRIYLGPLRTTAVDAATGRPTSALRNSVQHFGNVLLGSIPVAIVDAFWCVYSPTDGDIVEVTNGWVDNEFDTQRRRGLRATSRLLFPS